MMRVAASAPLLLWAAQRVDSRRNPNTGACVQAQHTGRLASPVRCPLHQPRCATAALPARTATPAHIKGVSSTLEGLTSFPDALRMLGVRKTATFYEATRELGVTA